jgi:hypothetical protein
VESLMAGFDDQRRRQIHGGLNQEPGGGEKAPGKRALTDGLAPQRPSYAKSHGRFEWLAAEIADLAEQIEQGIAAGHVEPRLLANARRALHDAKRLAADAPELTERFAALDTRTQELIERASAPKKLPDGVRGDLETATGRSLDHVRVHEDGLAAAHDARAVAIGNDIHVADGELDKPDARELVAHEVAHVVQGVDAPKREQASTNAAEVEADAFAARFAKHGAAAAFTPTVGIVAGTPMRKTDRETTAPDVEGYLGTHREQVWHTLVTQLSPMAWPLPRPLTWRVRQMFTQLVIEFLSNHVDLKKPSDVQALVETSSRLKILEKSIPTDRAWSAGVGALFAQLVVGAVQRAIEHAATMYLAVMPIEGGTVLQRAVASAWAFRGTPLIEDPAETAARELVAAKDDTDHVTARWKFLNTLDRVDDPFTRQRMKTHFLRFTGQRLEEFIEHADWHGKRDKEQAEALISEKRGNVEQELAAMDPKKRKELEIKAIDWAGQIIAHTDKSDANDDDNAQVIFHILGPRTPVEVELIRAQVRRLSKTHGSIYEHLDRSLAGGNEDEAVGALAGDPYGKAMVAIEHAGQDVARLHQIFNDLKVNGQLNEFLRRYKEPAKVQIGQAIKARHERDELLAICDGDTTAETQEHVANLLADPKEDAQIDDMKVDKETERRLNERSPERVIEELEKMSPAELEAASKLRAWDLSRFDDRTQHRIRLLLQGKRAQEKAIGLRIAMAKHDQKAIEAELATASDDERAEIEKEALRLDTVEQQQRAAGRGDKDWKNAQGRTLDKQLDAHYTTQEVGPTGDGSLYETARAMVEKENASDDRHAAQEIEKNGKISEETEIYRARGNLQLKAQLLEKIPTNKKRDEIREAHDSKYRPAVMLPIPSMSLGPATIRPGDQAYQPDKAREQLDANELRIENIRVFGVPAERSMFVQRGLQLELYRKQYSGSLEFDEQMRMMRGGAIGSQQAVRDIHAATDEMAITGESKELVQHADAIETQMLEVQREEKKKLAAKFGALVNTLFKVAAVMTANPVLFACVDVVGDVVSMVAEWSVAGEAYDPKEGMKRLAVDALTDIVMAGIAQAKGLTTAAKVRATVGAATTSTVVVGLIDGKPIEEILGDALKTVALLTVPAAAGAKFQEAIGKAHAKLGKGINMATQVATAGGISGGDPVATIGQGIGAHGEHGQSQREHGQSQHEHESPVERVSEKEGQAQHETTPTHDDKPPTTTDGPTIAAKVPDTTYESGGTFRIKTDHGTTVDVKVRRTNGPARVVHEGDRVIVEVPRGLIGAEFEAALIEQLHAARVQANTKPGRTSPSADVEALTTPPTLDQIESITGVAKGDAYAQHMAELRQFYADMEAEAQQHGAEHHGTATDGAYGWQYGHKAFVFSHGLATFEIRVFVDGSNVTAAELAHLKTQVHVGMDHYYNGRNLEVRGADGVTRRLHVEVVFVDNAAKADINVTAHPGNGRANLNNWYVGGEPTTHAHEVSHGGFGLKDEYVDSSGNAPDRATQTSPGVHDDKSLMGNYWVADPVRGNVPDAQTSIKQRHLDEIASNIPGGSTIASNMPPPSPRTVEATKAVETLASTPVAKVPAGTKVIGEAGVLDRDTYYVTRAHGAQMLESLAHLTSEGVEVRQFKKGFLVRREGNEWYFEFNDEAIQRGAAHTTDARDQHGLPPSNAATVELWGFRGVRTIEGRPPSEWTEEERAYVEKLKKTDPLLFAGHVGLSVDGGKTIIGFTPQKPAAMEMPDFLASLFHHDAYPGIVDNDTAVFERAREHARQFGWNTEPVSAVELVDKPAKLDTAKKVAKMSGMNPGEHGMGYSFPLKEPEAGSHFAASNKYPAECVSNCAAFPEKVGVPIPEPSGNLGRYIPELEKWAQEDGPKDFRSKDRN